MTTNVNENRRRPGAWKLFLLLAIAAGVSTPLYFAKYGALCTVLMAIVTGLLLFLAIVLFWKRYSFRDLFIETDEEKAKKEERRKRREERKRERAEWFKHTTAFVTEEPSAEKQTVAETVPEPPKQEEAKETKETTSGYAIGDVYFTLPVSCIGNYVGTVSSAIKNGKIQLAHGLVLADGNQLKMSLNEMVKFGYKPPKGFRVDAGHDTLVPLVSVFKYDTDGNSYHIDVPNGFAMITSGENAGEMVPVDVGLIENL